MGEKIRDIGKIKIGSNNYLIELNEGYTKNEGLLIHIQNPHFRYLFKLDDYINLAATIMRAESEMDYYKKIKGSVNKSIFENKTVYNRHIEDDVKEQFLDLLKSNFIDYRIVENSNQCLTIIVNPKNYDAFHKTISKSKLTKTIHPYSEDFGYVYLYQMKPFELYLLNKKRIEVFFQLPCMSLTKQTWIPLDKAIQNNVWNIHEVDDFIDSMDYCLFRICWAIFKRECFSNYEIELLNNNIQELKQSKNIDLLKKIFFNFTERLLFLIEHQQYDIIIQEYFSFDEY